MNFLAHLHLAKVGGSSLLGNLMGDFVRGDPTGRFPDEVVQGIRLHRFVDRYTDTHPDVVAVKPLFGPQRRFSAIALDVFWDHCLIRHWSKFHDTPLDHFCESARRTTHPALVSEAVPERYRQVIGAMWDGRWIDSYAELENIGFALQRMSGRSPRMGPLALCYKPLVQHYQTLNGVFLDFYPDVIRGVTRFEIDAEIK